MLLDTNAVFLPVREGFPLDAEVERFRPGAVVAVPGTVARELERLVVRGTADARAARAFAERYRVERSAGHGDDAIVRAAARLGAWVVTADRALRARLTSIGVNVLSPRDRHRLELFRGERTTGPRRSTGVRKRL